VKSGGMMLKESQKGKDKADGKKRTAEQRASAAEQAALARAEKLAELDMVEQLAKRRKLVLPEPQVRDDELEHVAKQARRITSDDSEQQNGFAVDSAPFADAPQDNARERVRRGLASLPKPKNDFEIVVEDEEQPEKSGADDVVGLVEDASERDRRLAAEKRAVLKQQFSKLSKVLQLGLPRPDADYEVDPDADAITKEMQRIIQSDNKSFPLGVDIEKHLSRSLFDNARTNGTNGISPDERLTIENMIDEELGNINSDILAGGDPREGHVCDNESTRSEIVDRLRRLAESSNKQQKKLELVLGGYMKRQSFLSAKLDEALNAVSGAEVERDTFVRLAEMEQIAISVRISSLQEEVNALTDAERRGQERYSHLRSIKGDLAANGTSV
jgi:pre-mRNA-splicing factor CDC5/CEF1